MVAFPQELPFDELPPGGRWPATLCWGMVALVVAVYLAGLTSYWFIGKDSGLYLNLARNLVRGNGYTIAGRPHTLVPPGFPGILAGLMAIGVDGFTGINIAMILMGLATAALIYLMLRQLVHPTWALVITVVITLSNEMTQRSGEVLSDIPFMLTIFGGLWLYYRGLRTASPRRGLWELGSLLLVASCWIRMAGFPVAGGAALGLALSAAKGIRRRAWLNLLLVAGGCIGTLAMFALYWNASAASNITYIASLKYNIQGRGAAQLVLGMLDTIHESLLDLSRIYVGQRMPLVLTAAFFIVPVLWAMTVRIRRRDCVGPFVLLAYCLLTLLTKLRTRYWLPLLPLLVLYFAEGWALIFGAIGQRRQIPPQVQRRRAGTAVLVLLAVLVLFNVPLVGRTIYYKHRADYWPAQQEGAWLDTIRASELIRALRPIGGCLLAPQAVGYLSDVDCMLVPLSIERRGAASDGQLRQFLDDWKVRYVVINRHKQRKEPRPIYDQLERYLSTRVEPIYNTKGLVVYPVPPLSAATSP